MNAVRSRARPWRTFSRRVGRFTGLDLLGLALLTAAVAWTYAAAWASGGNPNRIAELLLAAGAALLAARLVASASRLAVPAVVVGAAVLVWLFSKGEVLRNTPLAGPFHYANAKGAFFMLSAVAALMLAVGSGRRAVKVVGAIAALAFALVPVLTGVVTASVLVIAAPVAGVVAARGPASARGVVIIAGALFVAALLITVLLAGMYSPRNGSGVVTRVEDASLSGRRVALWHDAWRLMTAYPETGVGPNRFQVFSPVARAHAPDDRWAHNEFLQQGAEEGVIGFLLSGALVVWVLARLQARQRMDAFTALAAVAVAGLGIHATVDHVLHVPVLPVIASALAGAGIARTGSSRALSHQERTE